MDAAVVLMAYGSPERLADVPAYYADIRGGRPIAPEHLENLVERYRRLGVEDGSPLNAITEETRTALEAALAGRAELRMVESWHDDPGFVRVLADKVRGTEAHVVFTAHSLPARILEHGDPYERQLHETAELVAGQADLRDWSFSYQSASPTGEPWLGPDILEHLTSLRSIGVEDVLVCPVGFVSDHLEIRWDIDVEAQEQAAQLGLRLARIEMPNAEPPFVAALAAIVRGAL